MRPTWILWLAISITAANLIFAQDNPPVPNTGPAQRPSTAPRPDFNRPGPWDQDVIAYQVSAEGQVQQTATFARAGVATIARMKDGRLIAAHQHFPENNSADFDKVAVRFSKDEGKTWTEPAVIQLTGLPEGMRFPFDPTLVLLPDGRLRLYFTSLMGRRFEESTPAIYSAISKDGINYTFEPGQRFGIEGRNVIDCAVALHQGTFHLYAPDNGPQRRPGERENAPGQMPSGLGYHATSKDGLNFTRQPDVQVEGRRNWLGAAQSDGKVITFFGTGGGGPPAPGERPRGGLWTATSSDGQTWKLGAVLEVKGADPGAVTGKKGGYIVVATSGPRPGTASERQRGFGNRPPGPPPPGEREPARK